VLFLLQGCPAVVARGGPVIHERMSNPDAVVVGSGPNGLTAAIVIARAGRKVLLVEAAPEIGGGLRSAELTLPGFVHDVCSAVHPMAVRSPVLLDMPLAQHGLEWVEPPAMLAHPFDDGSAAMVYRSLERTARELRGDGDAYRQTFRYAVADWPRLERALGGAWTFPRHPFGMACFGLRALRSADRLARRLFRGEHARGLFGGIAAHGMAPLEVRPTGGIALGLGLMAHTAGWFFPRGGAQTLTNALASYFRSLGGEIATGWRVTSLDELPRTRATLCDLSPRPFLEIAGHVLPARYRRALERYRYSRMGAFKADWALDGPIPWTAAGCASAGTLHLGGTLEEIAAGERRIWGGEVGDRPYVLLAQQTPFDRSRAPEGRHTAWAYCHVPAGSTADMLPRIEAQIERFAPGFRERVLARAVMTPADLERRNPNYVGGDIGSGAFDLAQALVRPTWRNYSTPVRGLYLCSASTPPGVGVHGLCGYFAARRALKQVLRD
jgi:phytoene dehydrogenase-like protein